MDILAHDLLDNGRLAGIVEAPADVSRCTRKESTRGQGLARATDSIKIRNSLSLSLAFRKIDSIVARRWRGRGVPCPGRRVKEGCHQNPPMEAMRRTNERISQLGQTGVRS